MYRTRHKSSFHIEIEFQEQEYFARYFRKIGILLRILKIKNI